MRGNNCMQEYMKCVKMLTINIYTVLYKQIINNYIL